MFDKESYVSNFNDSEQRLAGNGPEWVHTIRKDALAQFESLGFPTLKNEDWRFTRVRPLLQQEFKLVAEYKSNGISATDLDNVSFADAGLHRLAFVNGHYAADLSSPQALPDGVRVDSLRNVLAKEPALVEPHLTKLASQQINPFVALNTAHIMDGLFVHVPKNVVVDTPIHAVFMTRAGDNAIVSYPRNLIVVEEGAKAVVVESWIGENDVYFNNPVTEVVVGDNADVDHYKVQRESRAAYHVATVQSRLGRDSHYNINSVSFGGAFVRNDVNTLLDGEGIECTLDGLYIADSSQHIDNHTTIDHAKAHCNSYEMYKGILSGRAKAVFNGRINVFEDAQKTDAKQSNRCMLLSDDAQINSNPQLEIYADDVKCTHGATVGQIDDKSIYYLRTRGIPEEQARHMLIYAFANEVLERIHVEPLRDRLAKDLYTWLAREERA